MTNRSRANQNGFTMIEMLVSAAILLIFLLGLFTILTNFQQTLQQTKSILQFEDQAQNFNMNIRKALRNAVYTIGTANPIVAATPAPSVTALIPGRVHVNFQSWVHCPGANNPANNPACAIAIFFREAAKIGGSATTRESQILGSGLFYIPRVGRQPGFLILDLGLGVPANRIEPDDKDLYFGNVVDIQLMNPMPAPPSTAILRSVDISVTFRKFISSTPDRWTFCRQADIVTPYNPAVDCSTDGAFRDRVENFTVLFKNNFDPNQPTLGAFGRVHFFQ